MKKIIYILFTIEIFIVSVMGINILKDNESNNIFYKNVTSVAIEIKDKKLETSENIKALKNIADKNNIAISKYTFKSKNKVTIYTTDIDLDGKIKLSKGKYPDKDKEEFISNINTDNKNQSGIFKTLDVNTEIVVKYLNDETDLGKNDIIYLSTQNKKTIAKVLSGINSDFACARMDYIYDDLKVYVSPTLSKNIFLVFSCFLVALVQYVFDRSKEISILKINGYSKINIISKLSNDILRVMFFSIITAYIIFIIYLNKYYIILRVSIYFIALSLVLICINIILFIVVINFYIKKISYVKAIKGKKPHTFINFMYFGLKFIFIVFLFISITNASGYLKELNVKLDNINSWNKTNNLYRIIVKNTGEKSLSQTELERNKKAKKFYNDMLTEKNAFIIDASNYAKSLEGPFYYNLNSKGILPEINPYGKSVLINENYFLYNPIYPVKGNLKEKINYDDNLINILVPEKLKKYEKEIKKEYLSHFYFQKVDVENFYNEELNIPLNNTKMSDLNVNIIYVKNNQSYFTYDPYIAENQSYKVYDPIAILDTKSFDDSYYYSYMTSCMYFYSDKEDPLSDILPIIKESNLETAIQSIRPIYDEYGLYINELNEEIDKEVFTIIAIFISNIMVTYNIIFSYYEKNKYKQYLKQIFGYSLLHRNIKIVGFILLVNIIPTFLIPVSNKIIVYMSILNISLEITISIILAKILSKKGFNKIVKGEH